MLILSVTCSFARNSKGREVQIAFCEVKSKLRSCRAAAAAALARGAQLGMGWIVDFHETGYKNIIQKNSFKPVFHILG